MSRGFLRAVLPLAVTPLSLHADTIYTNITVPGDAGGAYPVCGPDSGGVLGCGAPGSQWLAAPFTPSANYTMTGAQVLVGTNAFGNPQTFDVFLYADNSGMPGSEIEAIASGLTATTAFPGSLITANVTGSPISLLSGTPYWLVLAPATSSSYVTWQDGGSQAVTLAVSPTGAGWATITTTNQFEIDGAPASAPEPSTFLLCAAGALIAWRKR